MLSLFTVSASFTYEPSMDVTNPETIHGQIDYDFGIYGNWIEQRNAWPTGDSDMVSSTTCCTGLAGVGNVSIITYVCINF